MKNTAFFILLCGLGAFTLTPAQQPPADTPRPDQPSAGGPRGDGPRAGVMVRLMGNPTPGELTLVTGGLSDADGLRGRLEGITIPGDLTRVTGNLTLPAKTGDNYTIRWWSSNIEVVSDTGDVTRPRAMLEDATVLLKAFLRKGDTEVEKIFTLNVPKEEASPLAEPRPALTRIEVEPEAADIVARQWGAEFKHVTYPEQKLDLVVPVAPGESIQAAIDQVKAAGGGVVALRAGIHEFSTPIVICDRLTLVGAGRDYTVLRKTAEFPGNTIRHAGVAVHDVVLKDFTFDGNGLRGQGINFTSNIGDPAKQGSRILLQNVTVRNVFDHGMATGRVSNLIFDHVNLMYNGNHSELFHNLYLLGITNLLVSDCNFSRTKAGKGLKLTRVVNGLLQRTEIRDLLWNGVQIDDTARRILFHKFSLHNCGRTALWFICERFGNAPTRYTDNPQYAPIDMIINRCELTGNTRGAVFKYAQHMQILNSTFRNRESDVLTLRCASEVRIENSTLSKPVQNFTEPEDVPIL